MTAKKRPTYLSPLSSLLLMASLLTSCGLIDMDFDDNVQVAYDMQLDRDTVFVTQGDSFFLHPVFSPDTVRNREVFFRSANEEIAYIMNDTIIAESQGETVVSATSVMNEITAFCHVFVLAPWEINSHMFSNDMVAYLTATIDGVPIDFEKQKVVAFVGSELRGIGKPIELKDKEVIQMRIYGHLEWDDIEPTRPELVRFAFYDKENLMLKKLPVYLDFDGQTHGSPSVPIELTSH